MHQRLIWVAVVSAAVLMGVDRPGKSQAASFDCAKASNIVETLICTNPHLSQMDERLAAAYSAARSQSANVEQLLSEQRAWIAKRNKCRTATYVSEAYTTRLVELEGASCTVTPN